MTSCSCRLGSMTRAAAIIVWAAHQQRQLTQQWLWPQCVVPSSVLKMGRHRMRVAQRHVQPDCSLCSGSLSMRLVLGA